MSVDEDEEQVSPAKTKVRDIRCVRTLTSTYSRFFQKHKGPPKLKATASEGATKARRTRDDVRDHSSPLLVTNVLVRKAQVTPPPSNSNAGRETEDIAKSKGTSKLGQTTTHSKRAAVSESQPVKPAAPANVREQNQKGAPRVGKKASMAVHSSAVCR